MRRRPAAKTDVRFGSKAVVSALYLRQRTCAVQKQMSAKPIAGIRYRSLNHLVGPEENRLGDGDIDRLCSFRIYDQLKLRRSLNRQGRRFGTLKNAINVISKPTIGLCEPRSVSTKGATLRKYCPPGYYGHPAAHRELNNLLPVLDCKTVSKNRNCLNGRFRNTGKGAVELAAISGRKIIGLQT